MTEESIKIVLIAKDEKDEPFYRDHLSDYKDIALEVHPGLMEFRNQSHGKLYSGFMIDIRTLIKSSGGEKLFFSQLLHCFPVMRVTKKPGSEEFLGLVESKDVGRLKGKALLDTFIKDLCRKNPPREIPSGRQKGLFRSVYLYYSDNFENEEPEKGVVENLTSRSCFVVSNEDCTKGSHMWLVFTEITDQTPIRCQIKWAKPWRPGTLYLPGYGVSFVEITDQQSGELAQLIKS